MTTTNARTATTAAPRVPPAEMGGLKGTLVKRMVQRKLNGATDPIGVMWHHPGVLKVSFRFARGIDRLDACDPQLKTLAHMATMSVVGCRFCLDLGYYRAHEQGLDLEKAREVPVWRESERFTTLERDVMGYAEAMSATPPAVTDEQSAALLAQLGPAGLLELTSVVAAANMMSRTNIALGIEPVGLAASCGLRPLAT